jgi:hypothetical protein
MPLPIIPLVLGALIGGAAAKSDAKSGLQAVKGRKKKDGTTGKPYIRKKPTRK